MPVIHRKETRQATSRTVRWALVGIAALIAVLGLTWLVFQAMPDLFTSGPSRDFGTAAEASARASVRTSALQLLGGLVLALGALFTARTYRLNQERQITERFTAAIDQLAHEQIELGVSSRLVGSPVSRPRITMR